MLSELPSRIERLPQALRLACQQIFHVALAQGQADPPESMHNWVIEQFGSLQAVQQQTIVRIINRLTLEGTHFNALRAQRPLPKGGGDEELEAKINQELAESKGFQDPLRNTTYDLFGRIHGQHCITASNIAKYDGWHGVIIFDQPHPLHFNAEQLRDYLATGLAWLQAAHSHDQQAIYPLIFWNCLPKAGASQMHGHMQLALGKDFPYAMTERWRRAAAQYGPNYFDDFANIHRALGLELPLGIKSIQCFAHLTPARNNELIFLGQHSQNLDAMAQALAKALDFMQQQLGVRSFNMLLSLPPFGPANPDWHKFPAIMRIADRGNALSTSSDFGAVELFATGITTTDPFAIAQSYRTHQT
jgi:hypothetical protein